MGCESKAKIISEETSSVFEQLTDKVDTSARVTVLVVVYVTFVSKHQGQLAGKLTPRNELDEVLVKGDTSLGIEGG